MTRPMRRFWYWWTGDNGSPWVRVKWWATYRWIDDPRRPNMRRCWATCVNWALGFDSLSQTLNDAEGNERCQAEAREIGACYCCRFACRETLLERGCVDPELYMSPDLWLERPARPTGGEAP